MWTPHAADAFAVPAAPRGVRLAAFEALLRVPPPTRPDAPDPTPPGIRRWVRLPDGAWVRAVLEVLAFDRFGLGGTILVVTVVVEAPAC